MWYPTDNQELQEAIKRFLQDKKNAKKIIKEIHGLIVPHAGYEFSGKIAGKAFSLLKSRKIEKAIVLGPSHYSRFYGIKALKAIKTPLGEAKIIKNNFEKIEYEHSINNQVPFLQVISPSVKILPLAVGEISPEDAKKIAEYLLSIKNAVYIFSSDLSHFLNYEEAVKRDKKTIEIIKDCNEKKIENADACGIFSLLILIELCKIKSWKPKLIEYKNSGDVIGEKNSVVGYASFWF